MLRRGDRKDPPKRLQADPPTAPPKDPPSGVGVVKEALGDDQLHQALDRLGSAGATAQALDEAVDRMLGSVSALSDLTSSLTMQYLDRIRRPISALSQTAGVFLTARGYAAHLVVETEGGAFGITDVPVLGTLPPLRRGQVPRDLLIRVVKATRRTFHNVRALDEATWDGLVLLTQWRVHRLEPEEGAERGFLDLAVVDGMVRFGWILRQVDLHYGQEPERS